MHQKRYRRRWCIATVSVTFGGWTVTPHLQGRSAGDLADVVSGAAPAYDLTRCPARVVGIEIAGPGSRPVRATCDCRPATARGPPRARTSKGS
ncbi:hypothetical protein I546_5816 [Mycobacterium kansasii 732]|nr:hypothetical protein I546_5816 [Mycobacterium kansasii 732]